MHPVLPAPTLAQVQESWAMLNERERAAVVARADWRNCMLGAVAVRDGRASVVALALSLRITPFEARERVELLVDEGALEYVEGDRSSVRMRSEALV